MPHTPAAQHARIHYRIEPTDIHAHLFTVTLTIAQPAAGQEVSLPVWIPGSYLVREFSKNLQNLTARQGKRTVALTQLDKHRWRSSCAANKPLEFTYQVHAHDNSVRTAWLDAGRGFFNGTSLCLQVLGQEKERHTLEIAHTPATAHWAIATGLTAVTTHKSGFGLYSASDYDELVDCPVEMGTFWVGRFKACGIPHQFVVTGALPSFDSKRLLADTQRICEAAIRFWHGDGKAPHRNYVFMLNAVGDGYGGLEHRNSTALICCRRDLPRQQDTKTNNGYTTLLGLISHEYFHTWNVKRLRPTQFTSYDYSQENHTDLLWFFEGFTSYYDDLLLRRAGLIDDATYLQLMTKTINQVLQTPGRKVQSVAQASFDAWVKYYRQDENTPNATVSYYTKGALVALCLDLTLRSERHTTLDEVMRALWVRTGGGPMGEVDLLEVLETLGQRSFAVELQQWVHGTDELPLQIVLAAHGVSLESQAPQLAQRLGLRVTENHSVHIKTVLRGGAAEKAGMSPGDEWLGVEALGQAWRIQKLEDVGVCTGAETTMEALVARDGRLLRLTLQLESPLTEKPAARKKNRNLTAASRNAVDTVSLTANQPALLKNWLD